MTATNLLMNQAQEKLYNGRLSEALMIYRQVLEADPGHADAMYRLGCLCDQIGKNVEAVDWITRAIQANPKVSVFYTTLGRILKRLGHGDETLDVFAEAVRLAPHDQKARLAYADALLEAGRPEEAKPWYESVLADNFEDADAHAGLALALEALGAPDLAIAHGFRAVVANPGHVAGYQSLVRIFEGRGDLRRAVSIDQMAQGIHAPKPKLDALRGLALQALGKLAEAAASYQKAIVAFPDDAESHFNLAMASLTLGNYATGWREYDWRFAAGKAADRGFSQPTWIGGEFQGKTLLVYAEQGAGDVFQFVRYLPMVKALGGTVLLECHPGMGQVLEALCGVDEVFERSPDLTVNRPFDLQIPLMSLPRLFPEAVETSYLTVDSNRADLWREKLDTKLCERWGTAFPPTLKAGIVWQGNVSNPEALPRSCGVAPFLTLSDLSGIAWVSLQVPEPPMTSLMPFAQSESQREMLSGMVRFGEDLKDFADTAALIQALDIVITIDTSVAHLAGALGKQVLTVLPFTPDWRWLQTGSKTPWYPGMTLFRQPRPGDWETVFQEVRQAILAL